MTRPLALATCAYLPAEADEEPLTDALTAAGVHWQWVVWDDDAVDWSAFAAVLIRTPWDYTTKIDAFRAWAARVGAITTLWNPAAVIEWNSHKGYLAELAERGVAIPPTVFVTTAAPVADLAAIVAAERWRDGIVVKPAAAAGSIGLSLWSLDDDGIAGALGAIGSLRAQGHEVLVQPLLAEVATVGETSLIFLDGEPSHAVVKVPADGDIRSQPEYGGRLTAVSPTPAQLALGYASIEATNAILGLRPGDLLYARVDMVDLDGTPRLMELELIEPDLFVGFEAGAAARVARAVATRLA